MAKRHERSRRRSRRDPAIGRRGLTLIELVIGLAIAAMACAVAIGAINSLTSSSLHSTAVELTGAIKTCYDRAIMQRRTERLSIDLDKGLWWIDYTEDPFAVSSERAQGKSGEKESSPGDKGGSKSKKSRAPGSPGEASGSAAGALGAGGTGASGAGAGAAEAAKGIFGAKSIFDDPDTTTSDDVKRAEVKRALEGGKAIDFKPDDELPKPRPFPSGVKVTRMWAGHQEEAFTSGIARIHFFNAGWTEPAQIELSDGSDFVTLKIYPLTGRVRTYDRQLDVPKSDHEDGKDEDRE